ncbi:MAG TPA: hypothetical protein VIY48_08725 [Candidatus Paceibacterota bacterium]
MNQNFVIIASNQAHPIVGRLNALSTAETLAGGAENSLTSKAEARAFLEGDKKYETNPMRIYGPMRTVSIFPVAAVN